MNSAVLCALVVLSVFAISNASVFVGYKGKAYGGKYEVKGACGCQELRYDGSYRWFGLGEKGQVYAQAGCKGKVAKVLPKNSTASSANAVNWKSLKIVCPCVLV